MYIVYRRNSNGKLKAIIEFDELTDMFWSVREADIINHFGYTDVDRRKGHHTYFGETLNEYDWIDTTSYRYVVVHNDKIVVPDRLVGLYRKWYNVKPRRRWQYRKSAWGGYRRLRTTQERKWAHAFDDEEFAPKVRAVRQGKNLPDSWDDYRRHAQKSWKWQSKRKNQWKEKKYLELD